MKQEDEVSKVKIETEREIETGLQTGDSGLPVPSPETPRALVPVLVSLVAIICGLIVSGIMPRLDRQTAAAEAMKEQQVMPTFRSQKAVLAPNNEEITLPAGIEPVQDIPLYARADGYLRERFVDIGDRVKKGELLAVLETPELDEQLKQGKADLNQAEALLNSSKADLKQGQANLATAQANLKKMKAQLAFSVTQVARYRQLADEGAISTEQRDSKVRDVEADEAAVSAAQSDIEANQSRLAALKEKVSQTEAAVRSARANINRLSSLAGFQNIIAPCDGVVTARNVDNGALIAKGSDSNNKELLRIARTDVLRIFVNVPQTFFTAMKTGLPATIKISEMPRENFYGRVAHVAGGLDAASRTLRTEVRIANDKGLLMPGMYAQVVFNISRPQPPLIVASNAIVVHKDGQYVCTLDSSSKAHYQKVDLGRDHGSDVEIIRGIQPGAEIVLDPPDWLSEGTAIKVALQKDK